MSKRSMEEQTETEVLHGQGSPMYRETLTSASLRSALSSETGTGRVFTVFRKSRWDAEQAVRQYS